MNGKNKKDDFFETKGKENIKSSENVINYHESLFIKSRINKTGINW